MTYTAIMLTSPQMTLFLWVLFMPRVQSSWVRTFSHIALHLGEITGVLLPASIPAPCYALGFQHHCTCLQLCILCSVQPQDMYCHWVYENGTPWGQALKTCTQEHNNTGALSHRLGLGMPYNVSFKGFGNSTQQMCVAQTLSTIFTFYVGKIFP